ncbi:hypothetical protein ACHAWF_007860 [Thalassiosira exigua]
MSEPNKLRLQGEEAPVAIVGAGYAGLALANSLHLRSVPYVIYDARSLPFVHVTGGAKFDVPSFDHIAKKLELNAPEKYESGGPCRKDVIDSLLERVKSNLVSSQRIVGIEHRSGLFYLQSWRNGRNLKDEPAKPLGPFRSVVGADGIFSVVRERALPNTFLIGDARWAGDRWYDLGLRRIDRGANIALIDGLELGQVMVTMDQSSWIGGKFCAYDISRRRSMRTFFSLAAIACLVALIKSQWHDNVDMRNPIGTLGEILFSDECLARDQSKPLITFQLHKGLQLLFGRKGHYSVLRPSLLFWVQITALIIIHSIVSIILAIIIYYGIIQRRGSTFAKLLCWGGILPFAVSFPIFLTRTFNLSNRAVRVATAATPTLVTFRCLEALHGSSPHSVEGSVWNYCLYYSSVIEFVFDERTGSPAKASWADVWRKGRVCLVNFMVVSLLLSYMELHVYRPFLTGNGGAFMGITTYVQPGHIGNNFLAAVLTSSTVATGTAAFGFAICGIAGVLTLDVFDDPMFQSISVSDFWGRRWNRMVHGVLKRGVYKPVRKRSSRTIAALATFVASGLLHEYVLFILSIPTPTPESSEAFTRYEPCYGNQFCFFAWNGMLMALEYMLKSWTAASRLNLPVPTVVRSLLVVSTALPVSHWFTDEYVRSGLFSHYAVGFPVIVESSEHISL